MMEPMAKLRLCSYWKPKTITRQNINLRFLHLLIEGVLEDDETNLLCLLNLPKFTQGTGKVAFD